MGPEVPEVPEVPDLVKSRGAYDEDSSTIPDTLSSAGTDNVLSRIMRADAEEDSKENANSARLAHDAAGKEYVTSYKDKNVDEKPSHELAKEYGEIFENLSKEDAQKAYDDKLSEIKANYARVDEDHKEDKAKDIENLEKHIAKFVEE